MEGFGELFLLNNFLSGIKCTITKNTMSIGNMICFKAISIKTDVRGEN